MMHTVGIQEFRIQNGDQIIEFITIVEIDVILSPEF
jgi:hypothetical protein